MLPTRDAVIENPHLRREYQRWRRDRDGMLLDEASFRVMKDHGMTGLTQKQLDVAYRAADRAAATPFGPMRTLALHGFVVMGGVGGSPVADEFVGTDGTTPPNSNWTNGADGGTDQLKILTNTAAAVAAGGDWNAYYNVRKFGPDCEIGGKIAAPCTATGTTAILLTQKLLGVGTTALTGYAIGVQGAGTGHIEMYRVDSNALINVLIPTAQNQAWAANDSASQEYIAGQMWAWRMPAAGPPWSLLQIRYDGKYASQVGYAAVGIEDLNGKMENIFIGDIVFMRPKRGVHRRKGPGNFPHTFGERKAPATPVGAGPFSILLGTATEQNDALPILWNPKIRIIGTASETDTAITLVAKKAKALGIAFETDTPGVFGRVKSKLIGIATETDTAVTFVRRKVKLLGIATEADAAIALGRLKKKAVGIASETDSAQTIAWAPKNRTMHTATETDTAGTFGRLKSRLLGIANETDTAIPIGKTKKKVVGIATESDTAVALTRVKRRVLGVASETDLALAFGRAKRKLLGIASETDDAITITRVGNRLLGTTVENDTAGIIARVKSRVLGVASETDSPGAFNRLKRRLLGIATETDTAVHIGATKVKIIGVASETDTASGFGRRHSHILGIANETDLSVHIAAPGTFTIGVAVETDTAGNIIAFKHFPVTFPTGPAGRLGRAAQGKLSELQTGRVV